MANADTFSHSRLNEIYHEFLSWAVGWLEKRNYATNRNARFSVIQRGETVDISLASALHLLDWPYSSGSRKTIDVLISSKETVSLATGEYARATVKVNYFDVSGDPVVATDSLRFDFVDPPQTQHPVCHMHGATEVMERPESFQNRQIDVDALKGRNQRLRMPCAFVNFPGLLSVVAADHMAESDWEEFAREVSSRCACFPLIPRYEPNVGTPLHRDRLCAWTWY